MKPRILLVAPDFYDYRESISTALALEGYEVDSVAEVAKSVASHVLRKLLKPLYMKYQKKRFAKFLTQSNRYDRLLLIRGWMVPHELPELFRQANPNARLIMYQWDSKKNNDYDHFIDQVDQSFSFDKQDCEKDSRLDYKPLFFKETLIDEKKQTGGEKKMVFVAGYQDLRYKTFMAIKEVLRPSDLIVKDHIYIRKIAYFKLKFKGNAPAKEEVSFHSLGAGLLKQWYNEADVILDICHPGQSGLTMRTIETLGLGKFLITNNQWIKREPFYSPEQILVFETASDLKDWRFSDRKTNVSVDHLSLNNWVKDFVK